MSNGNHNNRRPGIHMGGPRMHRGKGEKAKDFKKSIKDLAIYCKRYSLVIFFAIGLSIAGTIFNIIGPDRLADITNMITDGLLTGIDVDGVISISSKLLILYLFGYLFNILQGIIMATVTQKITKSMRTDLSEKMNRMPLRYFDANPTGDTLSRFTNDVDTIGQTLNQSLGNLVSAVTLFLGSIIMMYSTNVIMATSGIIATVIGFGLMTLIISKSQKYFIAQQNQLGKINGHIEETYSGHNVVKVYNGEENAKKSFKEMNDILYDSAWRSQFMSGLMQPLMQFIGNLGYVVICVTGAILVTNGTIEFGTIVAFMIYIRLFTQPLAQMAQAMTNLQAAAAASERVFEFMNQEELSDESSKTIELKNVKGNVDFEDVHFGYYKDRTIINDFSVSVKAGQKIAIVGPTGAGKTTIINLLMRFYELHSGNIKIDGVSIGDITRSNLHDQFGMVLQDTWLFEGSIMDNIIYNKEGISREDVINASKAVGLHHFVETLKDGYDTILNDNASLSAGQKQLVTITRAMIQDSPMMILDEATSSVDTRTEAIIQKAMDKLMTGRTSFVIAHRLSTIRNADLILVMKDGDIIESGSHDELLRKKGFYADLYNSQFEVNE